MFVLDTNVVSELMRPAPDPVIASWVAAHATSSLFLTAGGTQKGTLLNYWNNCLRFPFLTDWNGVADAFPSASANSQTLASRFVLKTRPSRCTKQIPHRILFSLPVFTSLHKRRRPLIDRICPSPKSAPPAARSPFSTTSSIELTSGRLP